MKVYNSPMAEILILQVEDVVKASGEVAEQFFDGRRASGTFFKGSTIVD